jgi:hypothetical protein
MADNLERIAPDGAGRSQDGNSFGQADALYNGQAAAHKRGADGARAVERKNRRAGDNLKDAARTFRVMGVVSTAITGSAIRLFRSNEDTVRF